MTNKELIELLKTFPDDLEVVFDQYSDYKLLNPDDIDVIECIDSRKDGWITRYYSNQHPTVPKLLKKFLHLPGN